MPTRSPTAAARRSPAGERLPGFADFVRQHRGELHPRIAMPALSRRFRTTPPCLSWIDEPVDLWACEAIRQRWLPTHDKIPTDVFLWGRGEPPDPRMTKIGGVPYLPRDTPWPEQRGRPLTFLAQFGFHDSRDLVGKLPGDVLLVFAPDQDALLDARRLHTLWVRDHRRPRDAADVAPPAWTFFRGFGVRYRSWDAPAAREFARGVEHGLDVALTLLMGTGLYRARVSETPVLQATKIGGAPAEPPAPSPRPPGQRFLCQLSTVSFEESQWSCVNERRRPSASAGYDNEDRLNIGDVGAIALWVDSRGRVTAHASCG